VRVSRAIGDQWLVEDGLRPGDRVIVEGLQKVQPGMPVEAERSGRRAYRGGRHLPRQRMRPRKGARPHVAVALLHRPPDRRLGGWR